MPTFSPTIIFAGGSGTTLLVVLYLFIKYPDHVQKWVGILSRAFNYIFKKTEYFTTKWEIEGKLNSFAGNLETDGGVPYDRIKLQWTARNEDEEIAFEDGETIIVMRDKNHRNKNFVHAAYFYTSEILLKNTKRKLPKHLKTSIDLFATKKLFKRKTKLHWINLLKTSLFRMLINKKRSKGTLRNSKKLTTSASFFVF